MNWEQDGTDLLVEALRITSGDRQAQYGPPDQDFRRTADMLNSLFKDMLKEGCKFEPYHVAMIMIMVKLSRQLHQRKADNWLDMAGYARCGWICDKVAKSTPPVVADTLAAKNEPTGQSGILNAVAVDEAIVL